jgi:ribosomal protein S12 methylthiotransferase accessory factor
VNPGAVPVVRPSAAPADISARVSIASEVAAACGVTRLADITGLDRIGVPVWQAVRPMSRSVSVHQGKALDAASAKLGACMEAIECHHAEQWQGERRVAAYSNLPERERLPRPDDCALARGTAGPEPIAWTPVAVLGSPGSLWVPSAAVSLDFCRPRPPWVDCGSNGQGAGFDVEFAGRKALLELIERDALRAWLGKSFVDRARDGVALPSIGFDWFQRLREGLERLRIRLRLFALSAVVPVPVFLTELTDLAFESRGLPIVTGVCADIHPETALKGAVTEAAQCRLTEIAGARDDLDPHRPETASNAIGLALPLPRTAPLAAFERWLAAPPLAGGVDSLVSMLSDAGYPLIGRVELSPRGSPVRTVKMFAPGLGASNRARRAPAA